MDLQIEHERTAGGGRYFVRIEGSDRDAELTYAVRGDHLISANHTYTPRALRGQGIARALVERMVADARAEGRRILPVCPYVRELFAGHPDWADVAAQP